MKTSSKTHAIFAACLATAVWAAATASTQRIVIIGDSTVCDYAASKYPWVGWGQVLSLYFKSGAVTVQNDAIGGRSSRSFIEDGHWATTLASLQKGDILMVQFGHNDRDYTKAERYTDTTDYKKYLTQYAKEARAKGAHPVFVTPMNMNTWTGTAVREVFTEAANNYRAAMIHAAASINVPVLDLEKKSKLLMDTMKVDYMARFHFMGLDVGEYAGFPDGSTDGTHFQELGSLENARMITEEIARQPNDSILKLLAPLLTTLQTVTVKTDIATKDTITRTRNYPAGATITLKVKSLNGKKTLRFWMDEKGNKVTDQLRCTFVADGNAHTYTAVYSANTTALGLAAPPPSIHRKGQILTGLDGAGAQVVDARGWCWRTVPTGRTSVDLSGFPRGVYWIRSEAPGSRPIALPLGE
jgi:lysophospholipase L1-like esterase